MRLRSGSILLLLAAVACGHGPRARHPNVVLILVDTLRKDYVHTYGYPRDLSPAIDALGAGGVVFENHVAHASQTIPSTLSLLLSRTPADHGFMPRSSIERPPRYPDELVFLTEVFHDAGYATAGFMANPLLGPETGFGQGFDHFRQFVSPGTRGDVLTRAASEWLEAWSQLRGRPFYVYLHYMDVHQPYDAPEEYKRRIGLPSEGMALTGNRALAFADPVDLAYSRSAYAAGVAYADDQVAALLRELDKLGVRQDTIVVLTADHGEEFGEHGGVGHGTSVYGELVRVPLILCFPGRVEAGRRERRLSQHIDVAPTLLRLAGLDVPAAFRGGSLFEPSERAFVEMGPWVGVYADGRKLVWNRDTGTRLLFAMEDELDQAPRSDPALAERLAAMLETYAAHAVARSEEPARGLQWTKEERDRLRALGYAE